jgi:hypothetical protein
LEKRLEELQTSLVAKDKELAEKDKALKSKDGETRRLQAAADARASLLTKVQATNQPPTAPGRVPSQGGPPAGGAPSAQQQVQDIANFANEQAKEVTLLREVMKRGMNLEDVEGLTFDTQQELSTQLDLMQQKKEIDELRKMLDKSVEGITPSGIKPDTGGRSVPEAQQQLADVQNLRTKAVELKQSRKYQEATWIALRAARNDPTKVSTHRPSDEGE